MTSSNGTSRAELLRYLREHRSDIEDEVCRLYLSNALTNGYILHPRKLKEIAKDDVDQFIAFLDSSDERIPVACGRERARAGLSHRAFVQTGTILRIHALRSAGQHDLFSLESIINLIDTFASAGITGYIEQFETQLLEDQEKMRIALARAEKSNP